jgi:guanylate kinase
MRPGETDDVDYHFVTDTDFDLRMNRMIAIRRYETVHGMWRYGIDPSENLSLGIDTVTVMDPLGYMEVRHDIPRCFAVFLDISYDVRMARLLGRGDDLAEITRREADDFDAFAVMRKDYQETCNLRIASTARTPQEDAYRILDYLQHYNNEEVRYDGRPHEGGVV